MFRCGRMRTPGHGHEYVKKTILVKRSGIDDDRPGHLE